MTTIKVLLSITASQNWPIFQLDVNTSFLHGDLNKEVLMQPSLGLALFDPNQFRQVNSSSQISIHKARAEF